MHGQPIIKNHQDLVTEFYFLKNYSSITSKRLKMIALLGIEITQS
jgi:hypothetical protein